MGAPMGNRNAAGRHRGVSRGAKKYLSRSSGRSKFSREFKKNWGNGSTSWEVKKALHAYRSRMKMKFT